MVPKLMEQGLGQEKITHYRELERSSRPISHVINE